MKPEISSNAGLCSEVERRRTRTSMCEDEDDKNSAPSEQSPCGRSNIQKQLQEFINMFMSSKLTMALVALVGLLVAQVDAAIPQAQRRNPLCRTGTPYCCRVIQVGFGSGCHVTSTGQCAAQHTFTCCAEPGEYPRECTGPSTQ